MIKDLKNIYLSFVILISILMIGVSGFMIIEEYSFFEAMFMTIITMTTVGYGLVKPLSEAGMVFTSVLIVISFGFFVYLMTAVTNLIIDGDYRRYLKLYIVKKKIKKIKNHVIVCGFGRNGRQAVIELLAYGESVVIIEKSKKIIELDINEDLMKDEKLIYIQGDASHDESLLKAKLLDAKALLTTLPNDGDNILIVLTARDINRKMTIISRASDDNSYNKLIRAGADNVMMPDKVGGTRMAKLVTNPDVVEFLEMLTIRNRVDVNIDEISCEDLATCLINKTVGELEIRKVSGANLIGIKQGNGKYVFNPGRNRMIRNKDKLFVLGSPEEVLSLKRLLSSGKFFEKVEINLNDM